MRTRFPFRYGIAAMTELPHVFLTVSAEVDGRVVEGLASEGLAPKWFTKDPATTFEEDLPAMLQVIEQAVAIGRETAEDSLFGWWLRVYGEQAAWAREAGVPPLLAHLGTSLVERAMIDAVCRAKQVGFAAGLRDGAFGVDLGAVHPELAGTGPGDWLGGPADALVARHTVGLGDPLTAGEISAADRADDSLPQALDDAIECYGLTHFKVKVCGSLDTDLPRLKRLAALFAEAVPDYRLTLDGNEQYRTMSQFREHWTAYGGEPALREFLSPAHLLFVEQPMFRDDALQDEVREGLADWPEAPPMIIDESDAELGSLRRALDLGYRGTSHKNCKGVFKGLANRCLIEWHRREHPEREWLMSGEDLANVGPVALLNDLEVMSALGITDVERNGHHYFRGLSMFPAGVQEEVLRACPRLYRRHEDGYVALRIASGRVDVTDLRGPGFGLRVPLEPSALGEAGLPGR